MLLIAEIILTIFAWRKGWKWFALIPLGIALLLGFLIGVAIGGSGGSIDNVRGLSLVLDIIVVIILIVMNVKSPKSNESPEQPKPTI
jgi:uncharacterized membrane protein YfcA